MNGVKDQRSSISSIFSGKRVLVPIIIGLSIGAYFLISSYQNSNIEEIDWRKGALWWVLASIGMMVLRDLGYFIRLRILSKKQLGWRQCIEISLLWEFASAISPSAIGGTAVAVVIMAQEKMKTGLTTTIVLLTAFLDELFYVIMVPIMILLIGVDVLFPTMDEVSYKLVFNSYNLKVFFWIGYGILALWTAFLAFAILIKPKIARYMMTALFKLPLIRRWQNKGNKLAEDIYVSSQSFKKEKINFWLKAFLATALSWSARFLMLNCLMMAFAGFSEHFLVYGRQLVMWVLLLVAVTPGGSGIAEGIFPTFMQDFLPSKYIARMVAVVWRLLSYYPYLIIGFIVLPLWLKRVNAQNDSE